MPYISQKDRDSLEHQLMALSVRLTTREDGLTGRLNYTISSLINRILEEKGMSYSAANEIIGVLECAKLELYRRVIAPYEDEKIDENGDVYDQKTP